MQAPLPFASHTQVTANTAMPCKYHYHPPTTHGRRCTRTQTPKHRPSNPRPSTPHHPTAAMHLHAAAAGQQHSTSPLLPAARSRCSPPPAPHLFTAAASNLPPAPSSQVPAANRQLPRPPAAHCRPVPVLQHTALTSAGKSTRAGHAGGCGDRHGNGCVSGSTRFPVAASRAGRRVCVCGRQATLIWDWTALLEWGPSAQLAT